MNTRDAITQLIFVSDPPCKVDIAMTLGNTAVISMEPAIALYHGQLTDKILISGYGASDRRIPEWKLFLDYALSRAVPPSAIMLETESRNTRENFIFSAALISREIGWSNIASLAIVTTPLHSRRAQMTARRYFPTHVDVAMLTGSENEFVSAESWWETEQSRLLVLDEVRKIGEYGMRKHLADF